MGDRVAGKVALVTGAARGQGRADALRLAQEGADLIVVDVCAPLPSVAYDSATPEDLAETVRQIQKTGRRVISGMADIRDLDTLGGLVDDAVRRLGRLDVIVANAGFCVPKAWDQVTPQIFDDTISTNVTGTWNTVMAGAPHLVAAGGGSVILISSAAGLKVQPFMVPYTTSKFAVRGMAKAFAAELGKHNIRVNSVHPTGVNTPMGSGSMQAELGQPSPDTTASPRCSRTCCRSTSPSPKTSRMSCYSWPRTSRGSLPPTRSHRTPASPSSDARRAGPRARPVHDQDLADGQAGGERILAVGRTLFADQGFGSSAQVAVRRGVSVCNPAPVPDGRRAAGPPGGRARARDLGPITTCRSAEPCGRPGHGRDRPGPVTGVPQAAHC